MWSDNPLELKQLKNDTGSALALMECKPRHNTTDVATLYGQECQAMQVDFYTFIPALCFPLKTNYKSSPSPFGIKMADRLTGKPIHLDILICRKVLSQEQIHIRSIRFRKVIFYQSYGETILRARAHVLLVDTGNSYQGCVN
jgi:hypothetical protein